MFLISPAQRLIRKMARKAKKMSLLLQKRLVLPIENILSTMISTLYDNPSSNKERTCYAKNWDIYNILK